MYERTAYLLQVCYLKQRLDDIKVTNVLLYSLQRSHVDLTEVFIYVQVLFVIRFVYHLCVPARHCTGARDVSGN